MPETHRGLWQGMKVYRWATAGCEVVAVQAGIGEARAAAGARLLSRHFALHSLVSFGFAGGLAPELGPGTIVVGERLVAEDPPRHGYQALPKLVEEWCAAAKAAQLPARRGTLVSAPRLVSDPAAKRALAQRTGACAVDMETAGIGAVAGRLALPWVALRAIVDTADETLPTACLDLLRPDGGVEAVPLLRAAWRSPALLGDLCWLARRTATARRRLDRLLRRWAMGGGPRRGGEGGQG